MAAKTRVTDAIVLNCIDHGESDVIVTLFSHDAGRLNAIAKGAKKSKKRFVNKLELFSFLHITYQQTASSSLAFLAEADLHSGFLHLRQNLEKYCVASVIREFLLIGVKENEPDLHIFRLSLWALHNLDQRQSPPTVLALFLIRFFDYIGYRPDLQTCADCGLPVISEKRYSFDATSGRISCLACKPHRQKGLPLSPGTIKMLQSAQDLPLERLHRLKITGTILDEALLLLQSYGNQLFQREIVAWTLVRKFLKKRRE